MPSSAEILSRLPKAERDAELAKLSPAELDALEYHWPFWARPNQLEPPGDWFTWLILAGRGYGKTRMGAEWVRDRVCGDTPLSGGRHRYVALIGETAGDVKNTMVRGESGLLRCHPKDFRPEYEPTNRLIKWPNGAQALTYNATEPDQLRGPNQDLAWSDELAKWEYAKATWDMLQYGLRLGTDPRQIVTTTPRPIDIVRQIRDDPSTVVTGGNSYENRSNLNARYYENVIAPREGTRLGRQEIYAEVLEDVTGSLWTREMLDRTRVVNPSDCPHMQRVLVSIDPAISIGQRRITKTGEMDDEVAETGITVPALGEDGRGYLLGDYSCSEGPDGWAKRALSAYDLHEADAIVYEVNQGGEMVAHTIRSACGSRKAVPKLIPVRASRGKTTRAEPISALYEQGRVSHVGPAEKYAKLEGQMCLFTTDGIIGEGRADRVDATVWGFTELFNDIVRGDRKRKGHVVVQGMGSHNAYNW